MTNNNYKLKMSLQQIREAINLNKRKWLNIYDTNCYAYALGLDVVEAKIIDYAYVPGVMSNSEIKLYDENDINNIFQYNDFINNLYNDLNFLGIDFREISPNDVISKDEWKIAVFTSPYRDLCSDFHFLRLCNDGIWHHKNGYSYKPTIYDDNGKIITNPQECFLDFRKYEKCLSLRLK